MARPDRPDSHGFDPNKSVVIKNPLLDEDADDVRVRGLRELGGLTMERIRDAAKRAEKKHPFLRRNERQLTQDEVNDYVRRRKAAGRSVTDDDIRHYQEHVAGRGLKNTQKARELMQLLAAEQKELGGMRREGRTFDEREAYIASSKRQPRIRELYVELGLAEMITLGDWSVNRVSEVPEGFGTVPLDQVEAIILQFYDRVGQLSTRAPAKEAKLIDFHGGSGTGIMLEHLRRNRTTFPFHNDRRLFDYWTEVGMADRIYFTMEELLTAFIADEFKDDSTLREFIRITCTLVLRRIRAARAKNAYGSISSGKDFDLLRLPHDPNLLKEIIPNLTRYIPSLPDLVRIKADGEFVGDTDFDFSQSCIELIREFCEDPQAFLRRYFKPEFMDANLAQHITIWPHRVIPGRFEDIHKILPKKEMFNLAHFYRSTSHLDDEGYEHCMREVIKRLKPGGVILDDGWRQSYTRFERLNVWNRIARDVGEDMRILVVADDKGPKSFLTQRCVSQADGEADFFSEQEMVRLLRPDHVCVPVRDFARTWPERTVRNFVVGELRRVFGDNVAGRAQFSGVHAPLDRVLQEQVFAGDEWQRIRKLKPYAPERRAWDNDTFHLVVGEIDKIRRRVDHVMAEEVPVERDSQTAVRTFPRCDLELRGVNAERKHLTIRLPKNLDVPPLQSLDPEMRILRATLREISQEIQGEKPIVLIEFGDCFTNSSMRASLSAICPNLFDVQNVDLESGEIPSAEHGRIYVIGGSLNDAYDPHGQNFIRQFCVPILQRIRRGDDLRVFATCFGSQCITEAYGRVDGLSFENVPGALQFGAFPVQFGAGHRALRHLSGKTCTVAMTRSGYTLVPGYQNVPDMKPLAFECGADRNLPPVAFSLMGGHVITSQFHLELDVRAPGTREILRRYLRQYGHELKSTFNGADELLKRSPDFPNVMRHVGPAFLVPALQHLASSLR